MNERDLYRRPWAELQAEAWAARRRHFPDDLAFAVPGAKRYDTECYANDPRRFASISLTGRQCTLQCEHCRGRLLAGMLPAPDAEALLSLGRRLLDQGCRGVLISGGADVDGAVPLKPHLAAIAQLKSWGLQVIVHTGLLDRETAEGLKAAGVDQVLFDVLGDEGTIRQVLHLDRTPDDYAQTLALLREVGVPVAPHVVIGLHYGQLRGELAALEIIHRVGAEVIVLVAPVVADLPPAADVALLALVWIGLAALPCAITYRVKQSTTDDAVVGHVVVNPELFGLVALARGYDVHVLRQQTLDLTKKVGIEAELKHRSALGLTRQLRICNLVGVVAQLRRPLYAAQDVCAPDPVVTQ